jgi:hypothetical protein
LTQKINHLGFFDVNEDSTNNPIIETTHTITGECKTRLSELKKYTISEVFTDQYPINGGINGDGIDMVNTIIGSKITYYINSIMYIDTIENDVTIRTTFKLTSNSINDYNFINKPIYKNEYKNNLIDNPKINNNLFIERQELSVFENNYKLEFMNKLIDVLTYVGGKYFHVKKSN